MKSIVQLAVATLLFITLTACGGGGAKVHTQQNATTVGQELLDLDKAYQSGLISEREYNSSRKKILNR